MNIRTLLTVRFALITGVLLLVCIAVIYFTAEKNRETEFFNALKKEAITKANLYFNANVSPETLQDIFKSNREVIYEVEVAIYDEDFNLLYHDASYSDHVKETREMIDQVIQNGEIHFYEGPQQVVGIRYLHQDTNYVLTATSYDVYGYNEMYSLRTGMTWLWLASIVLGILSGYYFSKKALSPIKVMAAKAQSISASKLDLRLDVHKKDELGQLANTFNHMLDRLERSFEAQKQFVYNISHEFRTPLSAMITELELASQISLSGPEYRQVIQNTLSDAHQLAKLATSLLDLAKASYDPSEIKFKPLRVDEILLDAKSALQKAHPQYHINIHFANNMGNTDPIELLGNEYLLKVAFINLFENGCKFSPDNSCLATIQYQPRQLIISFTNKGQGISVNEMKDIFTPFLRGKNAQDLKGSGIGLSLTQKIIDLHQGSISVLSGDETTFELRFENIT